MRFPTLDTRTLVGVDKHLPTDLSTERRWAVANAMDVTVTRGSAGTRKSQLVGLQRCWLMLLGRDGPTLSIRLGGLAQNDQSKAC